MDFFQCIATDFGGLDISSFYVDWPQILFLKSSLANSATMYSHATVMPIEPLEAGICIASIFLKYHPTTVRTGEMLNYLRFSNYALESIFCSYCCCISIKSSAGPLGARTGRLPK